MRDALGWIILSLVVALLVIGILAPRSLPGIALSRAAAALRSLLGGSDDSGDGEGPVDVLPGQVVPGEVIPWP